MYYVFYDDETTGAAGLICQIGAVICDEERNVVHRVSSLVNPHAKIDWYVAKNVTHITDRMLVGAPEFKDVWNAHIAPYLADGVLVAHGAKSADLHHIAKTAENRCLAMPDVTYVDTLEMSQLFASHEKHSLSWLATHYGIADDDHHDALNDAEVLMQVTYAMLDELEGAFVPKRFDVRSRKTVDAAQMRLALEDTPKTRAARNVPLACAERPRKSYLRDLSRKTVVVTGAIDAAQMRYLNAHARLVRRTLTPRTNPAFVLVGEGASEKVVSMARKRRIPVVRATA